MCIRLLADLLGMLGRFKIPIMLKRGEYLLLAIPFLHFCTVRRKGRLHSMSGNDDQLLIFFN
jgi:hypothetical protein